MKFEDYLNREETLKEKLSGWWRYTKTYRIEIPYRNFIRGIKNIKKWYKLVWNDTDFDYGYILDILNFKIKNVADYTEKAKMHENWETDVKYMRLACKLIDKIWGEDSYETEYLKYHETSFDFIPTDETFKEKVENAEKAINRDGLIEDILYDIEYKPVDKSEIEKKLMKGYKGDVLMNINRISENFDEYFSKNKLTDAKVLKTGKLSKENRAMMISKLKHEKAKKLFFYILSENIEKWWS